MSVEIVITGDKELDARLARMPAVLARKAIRPGLREAAHVIADTAVALAPHKTGLLSRSIKVRSRKRTRRGTIGMNVSTGAAFFKGDAFYGAFQELGTKRTKARKFMRKAFIFTQNRALAVAIAEIRQRVMEAAPNA